MKKLFIILMLSFLPHFLYAQTDPVKIDSLFYKLYRSSKQAELVSNPDKYKGEVTIPSTVKYDGNIYNVTTIGYRAFKNCYSLTSVNIPNSVSIIRDSAFEGCTGLTSITIPNSVKTISIFAFTGCSSLISINMSNSVTAINSSVFEDCSSLTSITIPNSAKSIGSYAFSGCTNLTSITIPNSVESIGEWAFNLCNLTSITIPQSVRAIGSYAFAACGDLTSIKVESGNTRFDSRDNSNAIIKTSTNTLLYGCKNTTIPNSVTTIGVGSFGGCIGLTSITIPASVTSIDDNAFEYCNDLTDVYCLSETVPQTGFYVFNNVPTSSATLHVPALALEDYRSTSPWSSFGKIVAIVENDIATGIVGVSSMPVHVSNEGGEIIVDGLENNSEVKVYTTDGTLIRKSTTANNSVSITTPLKPGSIALVDLGHKVVKVVMK